MRHKAVFTIVQNEPTMLPLWVRHYSRYFDPQDMYVLNHDSAGDGLDVLKGLQADHGFNVLPVHHQWSYDHLWLAKLASEFQRFLLMDRFVVVYSDVDELVLPMPGSGLYTFEDYFKQMEPAYTRCSGFEVVHHVAMEPPLDFNAPLLHQRMWWYPAARYSKPLVSRVPIYWQPGHHRATNVPSALAPDPNLLLIHLHKVDCDATLRRHQEISGRPWQQADKQSGPCRHNCLEDRDRVERWLICNADDTGEYAPLTEIPELVRNTVLCNPT